MNYQMEFCPPPDDFKEFLDKINPDTFLQEMLNLGQIKRITGNYSADCYHLCKNAVAWVLSQLKELWFIEEFVLIDGYFDHREHSWIQIGDYYLDMTLAQFIQGCPKIAITTIEGNTFYNPCEVYNDFRDWLAIQ